MATAQGGHKSEKWCWNQPLTRLGRTGRALLSRAKASCARLSRCDGSRHEKNWKDLKRKVKPFRSFQILSDPFSESLSVRLSETRFMSAPSSPSSKTKEGTCCASWCRCGQEIFQRWDVHGTGVITRMRLTELLTDSCGTFLSHQVAFQLLESI